LTRYGIVIFMVLPKERRNPIVREIQEEHEIAGLNKAFVEAQKYLTDLVLEDLNVSEPYRSSVMKTEKELVIALGSDDNSDLKIFFFVFNHADGKGVLQICTNEGDATLSSRFVKMKEVAGGDDVILAEVIDDYEELDGHVFEVDIASLTSQGDGVTLSLRDENFGWTVAWNKNRKDEEERNVGFKRNFVQDVALVKKSEEEKS